MKLLYEIDNKLKFFSEALTDLCEGLENEKYKSSEEIKTLTSKVWKNVSHIQQEILACST